ncbi:MAG: hypothetical protein ACYC0C_06810 [Devosia sp.]
MLRPALMILLAVVGTAAVSITPAAAQTCIFVPGDYVDADPGEGVSPALVMQMTVSTQCWADLRVLAVPGQDFNPRIIQIYEDQLELLVGQLPYDKPNGCPYAAGEAIDLKDQYGQWYPGTIVSASPDCGYQVDYWVGQQKKSFGALHADLRPVSLPMPPRLDPAGPGPKPDHIVQACTTGARAADLLGDDPDTTLKRALVGAINSNQNTVKDFSVEFESLIEGEGTLAAPGSDAAHRYQNAATGAAIHRYRMVLTTCEEDTEYSGPPFITRHRIDQSCYDDIFGEFVCTIDDARTLS